MNTLIMILLSLLFSKNENVSKQQTSSNLSKNLNVEMNYDEGRKGKVAAGVN